MEQTKQAAVGCVIMASGRAVRFGSDKLLADFGGAPLIARALAVTASPALAARVVVTRSAEVARLARAAGAATVLHSLPGRNDTVRLGLDALLGECPGLGGCIFLPGDQPLLRRESLEAMVRDFHAQREQNGSSSVWAGAPGAQSLCWGVPFCSEAVTLTPCAPCPRAGAAA